MTCLQFRRAMNRAIECQEWSDNNLQEEQIRKLKGSFVSEAITAFAIVFIWVAVSTHDIASDQQIGITGKALAMGCIITVASAANSVHCGALGNPAIVLAMFSIGRVNLRRGLLLIFAQLSGSVLGAAFSRGMFASGPLSLSRGGTPVWNPRLNIYHAFACEFFFGFILVWALRETNRRSALAESSPQKFWGWALGAGLVAGLCSTAFLIAGASISAGSANPILAFGPAVTSVFWDAQLPYWLGPTLGGILAAVTTNVIYRDR